MNADMEATQGSLLHFEGSRFDEESFVRVWLLAAATYGAGDVVTTIALVYFIPSLAEANPVVRAAMATVGAGGYLGLKVLVFHVALGVSLWAGKACDDPLLFYGPPLVLTGVGLWTTVHNFVLFL